MNEAVTGEISRSGGSFWWAALGTWTPPRTRWGGVEVWDYGSPAGHLHCDLMGATEPEDPAKLILDSSQNWRNGKILKLLSLGSFGIRSVARNSMSRTRVLLGALQSLCSWSSYYLAYDSLSGMELLRFLNHIWAWQCVITLDRDAG